MSVHSPKSNKVQARTNPKGSRVQGKITKQTVTPEMVEKRAGELAAIAGRTADQITASDRKEAKRELLGPVHPTSEEKDRANLATQQWDPGAATTGRRTERVRPRDTEHTKELVEEGMDEAEHDQMIQARKEGK